jgi:hypothetical protein
MPRFKLRAAAAAATFTVVLAAAGQASPAHAATNDHRYQQTVGSRVHYGPSTFCGDSLGVYNGYQAAADAAIKRWDFAAANRALDEAAKWKDDAASQGCAWPYAT